LAAARRGVHGIGKCDAAFGKITEKRRKGVTHLGKDQITRVRVARIGRRRNAGREVYSRSGCESRAILRGTPPHRGGGRFRSSYLQLRNDGGERRARIRSEHRGGGAHYPRHVGGLDRHGRRVLIGNGRQDVRRVPHFHVDGNRVTAVKRCQQHDHQDRQNRGEFDRRDAACRSDETAIQSDRARHNQ